MDLLALNDSAYVMKVQPAGASNVFSVVAYADPNIWYENGIPPPADPLRGTFRLTVRDATGATATRDFQASYVIDASLCPPPSGGGSDGGGP